MWHPSTPSIASLLAACTIPTSSEAVFNIQPKTILTIDSNPSRKLFGSLSMPGGSPWCDGKPTFWMVGHQAQNETPWCLVAPIGVTDFANYDYANATFVQPKAVILDVNDVLNAPKNLASLDRHDCTALDLNQDGVADIVCTVGASSGSGLGYNEVYLTNATDYSVTKIMDGRGLHKYPSMRNRLVATLTEMTTNATLLVAATRGAPRGDGLTNVHRMFRLTPNASSSSVLDSFYFDEVTGQGTLWKQLSYASCLVTSDLNNDGYDDILICNQFSSPLIFLQSATAPGGWVQVPSSKTKENYWRNVRVTDVTFDGIPDIVVVGWGKTSWLKIFKGNSTFPHFDFGAKPYFEIKDLPYAGPDVELLDVNQDGILDIYIAQADENAGAFCHGNPPDNGSGASVGYVPPLDMSPDVLLLGQPSGAIKPYKSYKMTHSKPGCGFYLERFGNNRTMILGQGTNGHSGHTFLLQW